MRNRGHELVGYTLLRLEAVYLMLWATPLVLMQASRLTGIPSLAPSYWRFWNPATHWVGATLYGFAEPAVWRDSGGSDLPFYWSLIVVELAVAVGASLAWTVAARGRPSPRLASALHTGLRLLLAVILVEYGAAKVVNIQFPSPGFEVLLTPLGEIRPDLLL